MHLLFTCFLALLTLVSGCEMIAGIPDRKLVIDSDASTAPGGRDQLCKQYCDDALANCPADGNVDLYKTPEDCAAICKALPLGKVGDKTGNSLICRAAHAHLAAGVEG